MHVNNLQIHFKIILNPFKNQLGALAGCLFCVVLKTQCICINLSMAWKQEALLLANWKNSIIEIQKVILLQPCQRQSKQAVVYQATSVLHPFIIQAFFKVVGEEEEEAKTGLVLLLEEMSAVNHLKRTQYIMYALETQLPKAILGSTHISRHQQGLSDNPPCIPLEYTPSKVPYLKICLGSLFSNILTPK